MTREFPITLVMVSYNKADTIGLSIESAATGSMPPDLIVVADDGSDDGTPEVAEQSCAKHGVPLIFVRNLRVGRYRIQTMRNTCAANALDGVVFLSDSDCIFGEFAIESHYELHRTHPLAIGTGPRYEYLEGDSGPFTSTFSTLEFAHCDRGHYCVPVGANYSFRKSLWRRIGGFDRAFEGSYGMEEFQFSQKAERAGAPCVSDPAAYVFHIPHETVFGNRSAWRNIGVFDETYGRNHVEEERVYLEQYVVPTYWGGKRKNALVGERARLDEAWGAPEGFVPPLHLELSVSLAPLIDPVESWFADRDARHIAKLQLLTSTLDWRMIAQTSPAYVFLSDLHGILQSRLNERDFPDHLRHWLVGAKSANEKILGKRQAIEA